MIQDGIKLLKVGIKTGINNPTTMKELIDKLETLRSQCKEIADDISKLSASLKEQENQLRQKANFCTEHKFPKEEEWIRMKLQIVQEIRFEVDLIESSADFRPLFRF